ncbi:c-type cytochrome [Moraxella catarrhalis]|uniref:c-type cytochrome n=1 Tax=Moraxella catarrhalis TaxID=480 RepID=UPI00128CBAE3|nr:c-type cytochrome [Moraxella catarrhalis]MPX83311.1 cytochrome c5 family protein [Moraxella catarrhalis]
MMTMKKAVMFSVAALLAVSTMATQAQEAVAPAETQTADATEVTTAEAPAQAAAPVEEAPKESPQVQKLVAMYPNLIARIAPYGKVCFDGEECDINITVLAPAVEGQARDGESLYKAICSTCHDAGLIGAPKIGTSDWASRIGKGTATLYNHAINGFNAMPARGGADISDEEVQNAVDYIIQRSS